MKIKQLSPSRSHRWIKCAGSVRAEAMAPKHPEDEASIANEGSAAHKLFELSLKKKVDAELYLGEEIELEKTQATWVPDEAMVEHVQDGVSLVRRKIGTGANVRLWTEQYVPITVKGVQTGGTLDCGWYGRFQKDPLDHSKGLEWQLHIMDLKYGYLAVAAPRDNTQIRIYANAKLQELTRKGFKVDSVHLWIYQPRLDHIDGPFMHDVMTPKELKTFLGELGKAVEATKNPLAKRTAGNHCLYCAASAVCPTLERHVLRIVRVRPAQDDSDRMGMLLDGMQIVKQWQKAVMSLGTLMANEGYPPTGWVLGAGRRSKVWNGEKAKAAKALMAKMKIKFGLKEDDYAPRKILGVGRVRALVPPEKHDAFDELWHWTPGKDRLQPALNARHLPRLENYFDDEDAVEENEFLG